MFQLPDNFSTVDQLTKLEPFDPFLLDNRSITERLPEPLSETRRVGWRSDLIDGRDNIVKATDELTVMLPQASLANESHLKISYFTEPRPYQWATTPSYLDMLSTEPDIEFGSATANSDAETVLDSERSVFRDQAVLLSELSEYPHVGPRLDTQPNFMDWFGPDVMIGPLSPFELLAAQEEGEPAAELEAPPPVEGEVTFTPVNQPINSDYDPVYPPVPEGHLANLASGSTLTETEELNQELISFEIEVERADGQQVEAFAEPVLMVIDLRDYGYDITEDGGAFYLAFEDKNDPGTWIDVPVTVHAEDGLISAEVDHFSNWQGGWRPQTWGVTWSPPSVGEFTGSATYRHTFALPPGRGGFTPSLSLFYNSGTLSGRIPNTVSSYRPNDPVADGWSMSQMGVFRKSGFWDKAAEHYAYWEHFTLTVEGIGYELYPNQSQARAAFSSPAGSKIEYFAKDNPGIRIFRHNYNLEMDSVPNTQASYWTVHMPNGTVYEMGTSPKSRQVECRGGARAFAIPFLVNDRNTPNNPSDDTYHTDNHNQFCTPIGWYVNKGSDVHGNEVIYRYWSYLNKGDVIRQDNVRVLEIEYNHSANASATPGTKVEFHPIISGSGGFDSKGNYYLSPGRIRNIKVFHGSRSISDNVPIKWFNLDVEVKSTPTGTSDACLTRNDKKLQFQPYATLNKITEYVVDNGGTNRSLPPVTFQYDGLPHYETGNHPDHIARTSDDCFAYPYLKSYQNGYGGTVSFVYQGIYNTVGTFEDSDNPLTHGYNYFVRDVIEDPGHGERLSHRYYYHGRCYGGTFAEACHTPPSQYALDRGSISGHARVSVTTFDDSGVLYGRSINSYHVGVQVDANGNLVLDSSNNTIKVNGLEGFFGKPDQTLSGYPLGTLNQSTNYFKLNTGKPHSQSDILYYATQFGDKAKFVAQNDVINTSDDGRGTEIKTRTVFQYSPNYQRRMDKAVTRQLGQVSAVYEYYDNNLTNPAYISQSWYRYGDPEVSGNGSHWIILPIASKRFANSTSSSNLLTYTESYYDNNHTFETPTRPFSKGQLTYQRVMAYPEGSSSGTLETIDSRFVYDSYGNIAE
ncbi:MAG: hypothetical protein AAF633_08535, partial [Chloroflexota bacterium]